jgi:protein O-GlcNAc transferase
MTAAPASRNAPCPCGSGKRFKDCHGALAALSIPNTATVDVKKAEALFLKGNQHRERDEAMDAIGAYEAALAAAPGNTAVLNNLGLALEAIGARDRALDCYLQVLEIDPGHADALGNLANAQFARNDFSASAASYDRLFAIRAELPVATLVRRAIALQKSRRLAEAEECFRDALARAPDDAQLLTNIGSLCVEQGRYSDADPPLARAVELDRANPYALAMLAHARQHRCAWHGIDALFAGLEALIDAPHEDSWSVVPFPLLAMPLSARTHLRAARQWARALNPGPARPRHACPLAAGGRLRVGFVSSDFRNHAVSLLLLEVWERLDRSRLETFAYGIQPADHSPLGQRIARSFEHFSDVSAETPGTIAQRIRSDGIAILFDLNGYTLNARPEIFARRPAPLQINSMGFPGTLGAQWYDYIHVDRFVAPPGAQAHYSERFFHMPHAYVPCDTTRRGMQRSDPPSRQSVGLPEESLVFCCFNNIYKLLPGVFSIWLRLLAAVPGSVLWLLDANADARANLRGEMKKAGLNPDRLVFAPRVSNAQHLARMALADLFLDTSPYGAHTTTNDALLTGVPVLTCAGETLASRNPGSQLLAIGLEDMVTSSFVEYEARALRLALDPHALGPVRRRLEQNRSTAPLFDMARYALDFEDGLSSLWRDYEADPDAASS